MCIDVPIVFLLNGKVVVPLNPLKGKCAPVKQEDFRLRVQRKGTVVKAFDKKATLSQVQGLSKRTSHSLELGCAANRKLPLGETILAVFYREISLFNFFHILYFKNNTGMFNKTM